MRKVSVHRQAIFILKVLAFGVAVLSCVAAANQTAASVAQSSVQPSTPSQSSSQPSSQPSSKTAPVHKSTAKSSPTKNASSKNTSTKKTSSSSVAARAKRKHSSPRMRRMHEAFVASTTLKPMARQLLQDRTPAAYTGVESFARRHGKEDAGSLAWLVVGYAHIVDHDYVKAIDPLNRAKPRAGDLGDYVDFYLG